jgi:hypothetical protein
MSESDDGVRPQTAHQAVRSASTVTLRRPAVAETFDPAAEAGTNLLTPMERYERVGWRLGAWNTQELNPVNLRIISPGFLPVL